MAMEKQFIVRDTHKYSVTALGYNPSRREFMIGCEDGCVKTYEADTGKLVNTFYEHTGWVTDFIYWPDTKLVLSSANDGVIIAWGSGGGVSDKVVIGMPVYVMAINPRRHQLLCGVNGGIRVYDLDDEKESGHYIINKMVYLAKEHRDIVKCIICHESRVYSAGYDQKLIIYDSSYTGDKSMVPIICNSAAHDAGICCLLLVKDNENNTWVVTSSFDKSVRIWSMDGKLVHKLDTFLGTVTGICYVPWNKTIWATGGTSYAQLFDPKSGDNVSDFIGTFQYEEEEKYYLSIMKYFHELNAVISATSRRNLVVWKYNPSGCVTALKCKTPLQSLTYTKKDPILIFSGDCEGCIMKWERMQSNHFMYSKEHFPLTEAKKARKKKIANLKSRKEEEQEEKRQEREFQNRIKSSKRPKSSYRYLNQMVPPLTAHKHPDTTIMKILFVEELDIIVAGCEDNNIYVWGFDTDAVKALKSMEQPDFEKQLVRKFAILLNEESPLLKDMKHSEEDSVTNRVAGFMCKYILEEHTSCVTSLCAVNKSQGYNNTYVVSGGWDRRLCVWNLNEGKLHDVFRNPSMLNTQLEHVELACDGVITDLVYCAQRNELAYSSSDKVVYIRQFAERGDQMVLLNTLQGHTGEVTCVCWSEFSQKWVTGSEDGTVRIWSGDGMNECEQVLSAQGAVSSMAIDVTNGAIVTGVADVIRVYEPDEYRLVQSNMGHTDAVKSILHMPERKQYVSCAADKTIRIWNSWSKPRQKRSNQQSSKETDKKAPPPQSPPPSPPSGPGGQRAAAAAAAGGLGERKSSDKSKGMPILKEEDEGA